MDQGKGRLTARRKFELYLETRAPGANVGEILRRYGVHLDTLRRIETAVERASVGALKTRRDGNGLRGPVDPGEHAALKEHLTRTERALGQLLVEYTLLKKSENSGLPGRWQAFISTGRLARS
jgi:transposase-like protein